MKGKSLPSSLEAALKHLDPNRRQFLGMLLAGAAALPLLTSSDLAAQVPVEKRPDGARTGNTQLKNSNSQLKNSNSQLKNSNSQLKNSNSQLKNSNSQLKNSNPQVKNSNPQVRHKDRTKQGMF